MKCQDQVQRFLFEDHPVRGEHVSLDSSWQTIVAQSKVKGVAQLLLGQALAAATLLVETLKIDGSLSLQIRGNGAIHLLVAEATSRHTIRGILRQSREPTGEETSLRDMFGAENLVITINQAAGKPHQGVVPLSGDSIASALQLYFDQSEQLPTRFWLACDQQTSRGLLLQKLPGLTPDEDAWNRMVKLAETTRKQELLGLDTGPLLHRLFHQESLQLFEPDTIRFSCTCSLERSRNMLLALGKEEIDHLNQKQEEVSITCEVCNAQYRFDRVDLEQLKGTPDVMSANQTRH